MDMKRRIVIGIKFFQKQFHIHIARKSTLAMRGTSKTYMTDRKNTGIPKGYTITKANEYQKAKFPLWNTCCKVTEMEGSKNLIDII